MTDNPQDTSAATAAPDPTEPTDQTDSATAAVTAEPSRPASKAADTEGGSQSMSGDVVREIRDALGSLADKVSEQPERVIDALREATTVKTENGSEPAKTAEPEPPARKTFAEHWFGSR